MSNFNLAKNSILDSGLYKRSIPNIGNNTGNIVWNAANNAMRNSSKDSSILSDVFGLSNNTPIMQALYNWLSGDIDFERQKDILNKEQIFNAYEAQKARDFEYNMSNTAIQRASADYAAAGYNPALVLGAGGASGYSAAQASGASSSPQTSGHGFASLGRLISSFGNIFAQNARQNQRLEAMSLRQEKNLDLVAKRLDAIEAYNNAHTAIELQKLNNQRDVNRYRTEASYQKIKLDKAKFNANYNRGFRV